MKTLKSFIIPIILLSVALVSCMEERFPLADGDGYIEITGEKPYVNIPIKEVEFPSQGSTINYYMDANAYWAYWYDLNLHSWLSVNFPNYSANKHYFQLTATANPGETARTAFIDIYPSVPYFGVVNGDPEFEVKTYPSWTSTNTGHSSNSSYTYYFNDVISGCVLNFDWSVSSENGYDKLTVTIDDVQVLEKSGSLSGSYEHIFTSNGSHTMVVRYTKDGSNSVGSDRAIISNVRLAGESAGVQPIGINITQAAGMLNVSPTSLNFTATTGTKSIQVNSDSPWTARADVNWITLSKTSGTAGESTLSVSVTKNFSAGERAGHINISNGLRSYKVSVMQGGYTVSVLEAGTVKKSLAFACDASTKNVTVASNLEWEVLSKPSWVTLSRTNGNSGNTELAISVSENESLDSRTGAISFGAQGHGSAATLTITQQGIDWNPNGQVIDFVWSATEQAFTIAAPNAWAAIVNEEWVTLSAYEGDGNDNITISVTRNDLGTERVATITLMVGDAEYSITIKQQGQFLVLEPESFDPLSSAAYTTEVLVNSSVGVTPNVEYSGTQTGWLTYSRKSDSNATQYKYTISLTENNSVNARTAVFSVTPAMSVTNTACSSGDALEITQNGRRLLSSVNEINMSAYAGTSGTFVITADGEYSIEKGAGENWYLLQHNPDNKTFSVRVTQNNGSEERVGTITLSLLGLPAGESKTVEVRLVQYPKNENVIKITGFGSDKSWD